MASDVIELRRRVTTRKEGMPTLVELTRFEIEDGYGVCRFDKEAKQVVRNDVDDPVAKKLLKELGVESISTGWMIVDTPAAVCVHGLFGEREKGEVEVLDFSYSRDKWGKPGRRTVARREQGGVVCVQREDVAIEGGVNVTNTTELRWGREDKIREMGRSEQKDQVVKMERKKVKII
ncbi:hypothetical protein A3H89_03615 [Candidatus Amesbacteria bacterium RIFCSPLOWO2_02_FULL_48_11]|uniref:Uncharacterized protein n=4 Tax=Candidatus Amesiibacteriota TaxID=1752730 RepID=A0A1F4ZAF2_9BACT|nr:MAG: hypothetical protein UX78_C0005G0009 [Candidatus Amesbacteria bacterium GW2011_GWA2_47_11]KKU94917.1 MAG: hypothetical protein UY22_C0004G0012 [Candidatus Amesbacteria bacterium GW2011_GWC1_48_10]KKW00126.1 MAG: hypothetical protein UY33_C0015G0013 [Candidatus Amesbacteria bacterium GW2011_GWA1_48_9]OGC90914.1 MAG: hypothetical protein A2V48_02055 [Candidatus Amesbacteria bacterium RBG_19FT_COMBO_48_16]OGC96765.1 MAG: hypothetical protein A3C34_01595 [Candidatus Amesbacteria bacterium R